ncbi:MAG: TolC family protein [Acidobacteria bacterium]|nr:TolC family protein [Acidobacteriota bacterium]
MRSTVYLVPAVVAALTLAPVPALAQANAPTVSEARVAELLRAVGANQAPATSGVQSPSAAPTPTTDPAAMALRIEDAVAMALEKNLDIAVERLNPVAMDLSLKAIQANFNPVASSTLGLNSTYQLPTSQLIGGDRVKNDQITWNFGVNQSLPWLGTQYSVAFNNRRQDNNNTFVTFNPQYNSTFTAQIVQPLLRGRETDNTRTQLVVTRINRELSDVQLRTTVTNTLASVRNAYWDLVFAIEVVETARRSLALAQSLVEDNKVRVEVGTLAPIDVVQAEAEAAARKQSLAQLEAQARTADLTLKQLIVSGTSDPVWNVRINPVDRPTMTEQPAPLEEALRNALSARTDLTQRRRNLEITDANMALLKNQAGPQANLVANYGGQGIGGDRFGTIPGTSDRGVTESGGYVDALDLMLRRRYPTWSAQVVVSLPLGPNPQSVQYARAKITREQALTEIQGLELRIASDVTNARLQVESNRERVDSARVARDLSQRRLEAEQSKFDVGLSTNFLVVQAQRDLLTAENTLLRAELDYQQSLVTFERVQLTSGGGITINTNANAGTGTGAATGTGTGTGQAGGQGTGTGQGQQ